MRILLVMLLSFSVSAASAQPRHDPAKPEPAKSELDQLLTALPLAPSDEVAARIERRIMQLWAKSGGPTAALLAGRGARNLQAGDAAEALQDFEAALVLEPDMAELFSRRALARYELGDVAGAYRDLEEAIKREPRNFAAWRQLSAIAEAQGNAAGALAAWKKLIEIDPKTVGAQSHLKELRLRVEGQDS